MSIEAKTEHARQLDTNLERRDGVILRSSKHARVSKVERATKIIQGLESEGVSLEKLLKEIKSPGYAHMKEADMRILAETARTSFDNMLNVVGYQKKWTPEQRQRAERAMNARLFDPEYKKAFSFWEQMTEAAVIYNQRKQRHFRINQRRISLK